jgi:hypothetical protein
MIDAQAVACPFCQQPAGVKAGTREGVKEAAARRDLAMEAHVTAIALWYRIGALLGGVGLVLVLVSTIGSAGRIRSEMMVIIVVVLALCLGLVVLMYLLGLHLGRFSNTARIIALVLTLLGMAGSVLQMGMASVLSVGSPYSKGPPLGPSVAMHLVSLCWSAAYLWALYNRRAVALCTPEYIEGVSRSPGVRPPTYGSPFFWAPFILLALTVVLGILVAMNSPSMFRY